MPSSHPAAARATHRTLSAVWRALPLSVLAVMGCAAMPAAAKTRHPASAHIAGHAKAAGRKGEATGRASGSGGSHAAPRTHGSRHYGRRSRVAAQSHAVSHPDQPSDAVGAVPETGAVSVEVAAEQAKAAAARGDNAEALSRYLHVLARKPDDLAALTGAGRAALAVGDLNAATGFLAHAQDIAPQSGAVEAGLAAVSLQNNDPRAALRYLKAAEEHGISTTELASDRALAYDLRGDPRRAQGEYALALRNRPGNAALLRRLALSQAIAGDRNAAFVTLDPLLRRQDVAAWRTRAFVRAMTGDLPGAEEDAAAVVPANQLAQLKPYLARLAILRPAEKAAAVNLGRFPQPSVRPGANQVAGAATMAAPPRLAMELDTLGARPATIASPASAVSSGPVTGVVTSTVVARPATLAATAPVPRIATAPLMRPAADLPGTVAAPPAPSTGAPSSPAISATPTAIPGMPTASKSAAAIAVPANRAVPPPDPAIARAAAAKARADARAALLAAAAEKARKAAADKQAAQAAAKLAAEKAAAAAEKAELKANPARSWVQVAGGANTADLPKAWAQLRRKWPDQLAGRSAWTMHYRFTNRLLIGPFASATAAQTWIGERRKEGLATFRVDTEAGEPVERLGS